MCSHSSNPVIQPRHGRITDLSIVRWRANSPSCHVRRWSDKTENLHVFLHTDTLSSSNYNNTKHLFFVLKDSKSAEGNLVGFDPPSRHHYNTLIMNRLQRQKPLNLRGFFMPVLGR
jgi:hypothetical protein